MSKKCKVCGEVVDCGVVLHRGCYDRLANGNQWVSTADRLPPDDELVLVVLEGKYRSYGSLANISSIALAMYTGEDYVVSTLLDENFEVAQVSHWMPLPDLPNDL